MRVKGLALLLVLLLAACGGNPAAIRVWIDVPLNPTHLNEVQTVMIEGHAASPAGVAEVVVSVNGTVIATIDSPTLSGGLAAFQTSFTPTGPGEYTIQAIATGSNGEVSAPDYTMVVVGTKPDAIPVDPGEPTHTPVFTAMPTATLVPPPEAPTVNFWADPAAIEAGQCTTLYWETANVQRVEFGGSTQPLSGSYYDCMCSAQTYPLTVTYNDGSQETFRVTVEVSGVCATPTAPPDTTAPAPPTLLKPINGSNLACTADVILRWEATTDASGISQYRVQVERHTGDNNWNAVPGSVFTVSGETNLTLAVECGFSYRFRVRAVDGAGNQGGWSDWFTFVITLG
jgi:hypothetical protein